MRAWRAPAISSSHDETIAAAPQRCVPLPKRSPRAQTSLCNWNGVPLPGSDGGTQAVAVTTVMPRPNIAVHRRIFMRWVGSRLAEGDRACVQPGVEFDHTSVVDYDPARVAHLSELLDQEQTLVYEPLHRLSKTEAYRNFADVRHSKVGPALTLP